MAILEFRAGIRSYLYREISYQWITDRLVGKDDSAAVAAKRVMKYVHEQLSPIPGEEIIDKTSWNDLVRGVGWCDQADWTTATLLAKKGVAAKMAMMRNDIGSSPHTLLLVKHHGAWRVYDPLLGFAFRRSPSMLPVTLTELSRDSSIIDQQPRLQQIEKDIRENRIAWYRSMFPAEGSKAPEVWESLLDKKNASISRRLVNQGIRLGISWFGAGLANSVQDYYLARLGPTLASLTEIDGSVTRPRRFAVRERPDLLWFYKARNYHLYGRVRLARKAYVEIVQNYPRSEMAPRARLFWGILEVKQGDSNRGRRLLSEFIDNNPSSGWKPVAHYYLGRAAEFLRDEVEAIKYYSLASPLYSDAPERISAMMQARNPSLTSNDQ
ncbi:hypothetical protein MYX64_00855 [Nitrospinae bacterium AH_259_B05_G02_I21]|nr:hypothetical protein [Nitrospinae bacterium AH_259_B05_G02_I21]